VGRPLLHPMVRRVATGAAAALVLGAVAVRHEPGGRATAGAGVGRPGDPARRLDDLLKQSRAFPPVTDADGLKNGLERVQRDAQNARQTFGFVDTTSPGAAGNHRFLAEGVRAGDRPADAKYAGSSSGRGGYAYGLSRVVLSTRPRDQPAGAGVVAEGTDRPVWPTGGVRRGPRGHPGRARWAGRERGRPAAVVLSGDLTRTPTKAAQRRRPERPGGRGRVLRAPTPQQPVGEQKLGQNVDGVSAAAKACRHVGGIAAVARAAASGANPAAGRSPGTSTPARPPSKPTLDARRRRGRRCRRRPGHAAALGLQRRTRLQPTRNNRAAAGAGGGGRGRGRRDALRHPRRGLQGRAWRDRRRRYGQTARSPAAPEAMSFKPADALATRAGWTGRSPPRSRPPSQ
jgi:hypothetical protein